MQGDTPWIASSLTLLAMTGKNDKLATKKGGPAGPPFPVSLVRKPRLRVLLLALGGAHIATFGDTRALAGAAAQVI